mmetsp:Transcript_5729/g.16253  ORF Transcript_5729/g.16253 Transcript_5729/m.16253 type:complete len:116 (-) Transcript_5729:186-533(-)
MGSVASLTYLREAPHRRALESFAATVTLPATSDAAAASATKDLVRLVGEHATLDALGTACQFGSITRYVDATGHTFTSAEKYMTSAIQFVVQHKILLLFLWIVTTISLLYYTFFM